MAEQPTLLGRPEGRAASELERPPGIVEERYGDEEVSAEPRVHLRGLAAEGCDGDGVLEEAACVGVVRLFSPPRKSPTPQARLAPSAQAAASTS